MGLWNIVVAVLIGMFISRLNVKENIIRNRLKSMREIADPTVGDEYGIESVEDIAELISGLRYESNDILDLIKDPRQTIADGGGDCEDFAVLTYSMLLKLYYEGKVPTPHLAIAYSDESPEAHAFVYFYKDGVYHIFSNNQYVKFSDLGEFLSEIDEEKLIVL